MKTTVIHHSADYDGIFCREIARKFLPDAELIGWDFGNAPLPVPGGQIYVMDLPLDAPFGGKAGQFNMGIIMAQQEGQLVWIDHHASAIKSHAPETTGYRIDGVAACRLAWQWFTHDIARNVMSDPAYLPQREEYLSRSVSEPLAVRLAGEYDIWDHRGDGDVEFQFGLDCHVQDNGFWDGLLTEDTWCRQIIDAGAHAMACYAKRDADIMRERSFIVEFEGLKFLALTTARCNSNTFAFRDVPETGHDALMAFFYNGTGWTVSLYHAAHRKDLDLSLIAVKHGGGGHRGACGFRTTKLPFLP
jgi:oligoribonuclease NrnB/cAMP/cGMP phosphodiesterase (DHH superfamily)